MSDSKDLIALLFNIKMAFGKVAPGSKDASDDQQKALLTHEDIEEELQLPKQLKPVEIEHKEWRKGDATTHIESIVMLRFSLLKVVLIVVPLALITGLFFLLTLWWFTYLRKIFFYTEV
jgi:hypothetical protein